MKEPNDTQNVELIQLFQLYQKLDERVAHLEQSVKLLAEGQHAVAASGSLALEGNRSDATVSDRSRDSLELKIGEFWLARAGTIVLLLGIAFFVSYPFQSISSTFISIIGYLVVAGILAISRYWRTSYQYLSGLLLAGGLTLLYFVTLRLHFLNTQPVLSSKALGLLAVVLILGVNFYFATTRQSEFLTGLTLVLCYATSMISDTSHFALVLIAFTSAAASYVMMRFGWLRVFLLSMVLTFLAHLLWMLNNPLMGNPMQAIPEHHYNIAYLFVYGLAFALPSLLREQRASTAITEVLVTMINALGMFVVASLAALTFFKSQLELTHLAMALFFLAIAVANWIYLQSKYNSAIYACFGNLALSIAIFSVFESPQYFVWLGWQSLLVISTAIWFRSRIIIIVNSLIYLAIFIAYLQLADSNPLVNLSYAVVALASARILNWKRERLELKTDMIRNAYLASAFIIVLYGLYHAVPQSYISLSWLGAALFYFGMSLLLRNLKYRWLAFLTILAMIVRVFVVDMAQMEAALRIVLFLAVGFVLLALSLVYTRYRSRSGPQARQA